MDHAGQRPGGLIVTMLIGIAGAIVSGFAGSFLGFGGLSGFDLRSMVLAVGGAIFLLFLYRKMKS